MPAEEGDPHMKRFLAPTLAAAALAAGVFAVMTPARSAPPEGTWTGDPVHSFVVFKIKHLGTSWTYGRFNLPEVTLQAGDEGAGVTSVTFKVKTENVDTGNEKRDQHLKSPDFFNAKEFPEISFKSTAVKPVDADTAEVTGDLSLHGVTKPVTVKVMRVGHGKGMQKEDLAGYEAALSLKRSDFGMTNMVGAVGDDVTLTVAVEAARK
jgi:polyisoprenoid-binding protein YceI